MAHLSPLNKRHQDTEVSFLEFASPDAPDRVAHVVETFGEIEAEYAAIRKGAVLLDLPQRATIRVTGSDRIEFLNRMLTQELRPGGTTLPPGSAVSSFWLNRKGRIDADIQLIELGAHPSENPTQSPLPADSMYLDTDILAAPHLVSTLAAFIFSEDITLTDIAEQTHRFALHGPSSARLLADLSTLVREDLPPVESIRHGQATMLRIADHHVLVHRIDQTGEIGLELTVPLEGATEVFDAIAQHARTDHGHNNDPATDRYRLRHAGWHAFNIARIEAGTPLFQIDFGPTNLPHETGVLHDRVNFRKGCYLGQEVVARMESLGHPKQVLCCIRVDPGHRDEQDQPYTGCAVVPAKDDAEPTPETKPVGGVTSSCRSPMLGDAVLCFAMLKWSHREPGTPLLVQTPSGWVRAKVEPSLAAWSKQ